MFATLSVPVFAYHKGKCKEKGEEVMCLCRAPDPVGAAKMAIQYRLDPDDSIDLELTSQFSHDGRSYAFVVSENDPADWYVFVKEIGDEDVTDLRYRYFGTWDYYCFKATKSILPAALVQS